MTHEQSECSICLLPIRVEATTLACGHTYHTKCIDLWSKGHKSCPLCRSPLPVPLRRALYEERAGMAHLIIGNPGHGATTLARLIMSRVVGIGECHIVDQKKELDEFLSLRQSTLQEYSNRTGNLNAPPIGVIINYTQNIMGSVSLHTIVMNNRKMKITVVMCANPSTHLTPDLRVNFDMIHCFKIHANQMEKIHHCYYDGNMDLSLFKSTISNLSRYETLCIEFDSDGGDDRYYVLAAQPLLVVDTIV